MSSQLLRGLGRQLRAQWAGTLTIALLLGAGTAHALPGSNTIVRADIVDGEVTTADVADGSLADRDFRRLAVDDIRADVLRTGQVGESSLGIVPVAGQAGSGRGGSGGCGESGTFVDCGSAAIDLAKPGRILIIASVSTATSSFVRYVRGGCRLEVDGAQIVASLTSFHYDDEGEVTPLFDAVEGAGQKATLTAVSDVYPTGRHVVGVECALTAPGRAHDVGGTYGTVHAGVDFSLVALSDR